MGAAWAQAAQVAMGSRPVGFSEVWILELPSALPDLDDQEEDRRNLGSRTPPF